jgi:isopenicillin N synthase-like dioxygenase
MCLCLCATHGSYAICIAVRNHGIGDVLISQVFEQIRKLFALPLRDKQALTADVNNRGWTPLEEEVLDPEHQSVGDTKEGYYIGREVPADSVEAALPLHGPNQWPSESLLPGFRRTTEAYIAGVTQLGLR